MSFIGNLREYLNPQQLEAVLDIENPLLVIAGAGSGKTRVIEFKTIYLLEKGYSPENILLLTFTRKAAREMLSRASSHNSSIKKVEGGTFHSFANRVLKRYGSLIGLNSSFTIIDQPDQETVIGIIIEKLKLKDKKERFPKKKTIQEIISNATNRRIPIEQKLREDYPQFLHLKDEINSIRREYLVYKSEHNLLDYDDLLEFLIFLLKKEEKVKKLLSERYRYIMVDEYQDTNLAQAEIIKLLAEEHEKIMVVGDDAQSIYRFRGANHENIMNFPKIFKNTKVVKLEYNYRSTQEILNLSNKIMKTLGEKFEKTLVSAEKRSGDIPELLFFRNYDEEDTYIADHILELWKEGEKLSQIAVLFRASYLSFGLQMELDRRKIPYEIYGGLKYYQLAHIKDILSYLRVMHNIKDGISWNRLLELEIGIGEKISSLITLNIVKMNSISEIAIYFKKGWKEKRADLSLKALGELFSEAEKLKDKSPDNLITFFFEKRYYNHMKFKYDDYPKREKDIEVLSSIARKYGSLSDFLADITINEQPLIGSEEGDKEIKDDKVILSTIHSAKGLEWKHVIIKGLVDGILPSSYAFADKEAIEEEKRLFYVAVTRAKDKLTLTASSDLNKNLINNLSPFLTKDILEYLEKRAIVITTGSEFLSEKVQGPADAEIFFNSAKKNLHLSIYDFLN